MQVSSRSTVSYSQDLRERVIAHVAAGNTQKSAAEAFSISEMTVSRWIRAYRKEGRKTPLQRGGYKKSKIDIDKFKAYVDQNPSTTLKEIEAALGIKRTAAYRQLKKMGYKRKKKSFTYREADPVKRRAYLEILARIPKEKLVYIDESGISMNLVQEWGWAPRGVILPGQRSGKHRKRLNIIGALRGGEAQALASFTGSCSGARFRQWVQDHLVKVLKKGQVVVLDNASFHKASSTLGLIESVGCKVLFLPPYSPDYNPIEHVWANVKRFLRKGMEQVGEAYDKLLESLEAFFRVPIPLMSEITN